jgi:GntR family transcriptional regulator/MocR family aminotransferase
MRHTKASFVSRFVELDPSDTRPLYTQIYDGLRKGIKEGVFLPGTRLPSTRQLADALEVSRNTVIEAFDELRSEGYLASQVGSGTYVADTLPEQHTQAHLPSSNTDSSSHSLQVPPSGGGSGSLSNRAEQVAGRPLSLLDDPVQQNAFRPGIPAFDAFPIETWSTLASRRWRTLPTERLEYGNPAGYPPLREQVAEYLRTARGARCEAEQVIILSGTQQAFSLVARALLDPGDPVCLEDPGFPQMRGAFAAAGADVRPVSVDQDGFVPPSDGDAPRMVGITPSHQYPLGITMSPSRRRALLDWGADHDVWILEDDYDGEYRYSGRPIAALQGMDNSGRVLYTGTFSKVLFPALRLGYLVVPPSLKDPIVKMRTVSDRSPPRVPQMILTDFMSEGHFEKHIREMRMLYANRQTVLLEALDEHLGDFIDLAPSNAGLHLVGYLPEDVDDQTVADRLSDHGIIALPLSFYSTRPLDRGGLLLGYAPVSEEEIRKKVRLMADILDPFI